MSLIGILPTLALGIVFILLGYFVWKRKGFVALIPLLIGFGLILFGFNVYSNAKGKKQATKDYLILLNELKRDDFWDFLQENPDDETIYFISLASHALYAASERFPSQKEQVMPLLAEYTQWIADSRRFRVWTNSRSWSDNVFFLAHAGIIMGHYQDVSKDETFSQRFRQLGEYLGKRLPNARYKHLVSHPQEDVMRPADNAAALYAISLYDRYYATEYRAGAIKNWREYLEKELRFAESHLPCSGFTETNRCKLDPTASPLGMMLGYLGAAGYHDEMLYREWLLYFKDLGFSPLSLSFSSGMRDKGDPRFCDVAAYPFPCEDHLPAIGMWLAAEYDGDYTFARLLSRQLLTANKRLSQEISTARPLYRRQLLTDVAIRVIAEMN